MTDTIIDLLVQEERWAIEADPDLCTPGFGTADTPSFVSRHFDALEAIDDYGSSIVRLRPPVAERWRRRIPDLVDRSFAIWETCGDEDSRRHDDEAEGPLHYTPCLWTFTQDGRAIERQDVADLCVHPKSGLFARRRWVGAPLPPVVAEAAWSGELGGERAFYLIENPACLSIRCTSRFAQRCPQYADAQRSGTHPGTPSSNPSLGDLSGGHRALFPLGGGAAFVAVDESDVIMIAAGALSQLESALTPVPTANGMRWRVRDEEVFGMALARLKDLLDKPVRRR